MKRLMLFLIIGMTCFTGCSFGQRTAPRANPTILILPTPSLELTAISLTNQSPTLDAMNAKSDFSWDVSIIQNNVEIKPQNNIFNLTRQPFTIRIKVSKSVQVALSVLDTDDNFLKIKAGTYAWDGCVNEVHAFCDWTMVSAIAPKALLVDQQDGLSIHGFVLNPELGKTGSEFKITNDAIIYERNVSYLGFINRSKHTDIPLEQFTGEKLYLLFLAKYQEGNMIDDNELKKLIIIFQ